MTDVLNYAIQILGAQAQEAIFRAPRQYRKDVESIERFIKALEKKAKEVPLADAEQMAKELEPVFRYFVDGLVSLGKPSLSWLWGGFDPFKSMRLEADAYARKWRLDWQR